jgi:threonine aldolase
MYKGIIDLRSDTVTRPTPAMREAIAAAEVGDDVFGDDPTVRELEERSARLFGKEAGLFVPSGTMGNQLSIRCHTRPGDEVLVDRESHIFNYEAASAAALAGVQLHPVDAPAGFFGGADIEARVRPSDYHFPSTRLVCIENTHNRRGGALYPFEKLQEIREVADRLGLRVHLDGARIMNASIAARIEPPRYGRIADSIQFCFSKGLGAPIGSMIVGDADFIRTARWERKRYGGGMRQVGILAAACLHALDHHVDRLAEDHANARALAEAVDGAGGISLAFAVETNIVVLDLRKTKIAAPAFLVTLKQRNVLAVPFGPGLVRMVTHLDVTAADVAAAAVAVREAMGAGNGG